MEFSRKVGRAFAHYARLKFSHIYTPIYGDGHAHYANAKNPPAIHMNNRWYCYQLISNSIPIIYIIHIIVDTLVRATVILCVTDGRIVCGMVSV